MYPKPVRIVDEAYLDFVRSLPCCVHRGSCGEERDAHHLVTRGAGGSDYTAVPLCRLMHSEYHQVGALAFEAAHGVNLWQVCAYTLAEYVRLMKAGT